MKRLLLYFFIPLAIAHSLSGCRSYYSSKMPDKKIKASVNPMLPYLNLASLPKNYWLLKRSAPTITKKSTFAYLNKDDADDIRGFNSYLLGRVADIYSAEMLNNISKISDKDIEYLDYDQLAVADLRITKYKKTRNPLLFVMFTGTSFMFPVGMVGVPLGHRKAVIKLEVDLKDNKGNIIKTYSAKGRHVTLIGAYFGYKIEDAPDKAHDKALIKALKDVKKQIAADADFINSKTVPGRLSEDEVIAKENTKKGMESFNSEKYDDAIFYLTSATQKKKEFKSSDAELFYKLGSSYIKQGGDSSVNKAIVYLEKSIELDPNYDLMVPAYLYICYNANDDAEKADYWINYALTKFEPNEKQKELLEDWRAKNKIRVKHIEAGKPLMQKPLDVKINNLGEGINTSYADNFPSLSADESLLYFTSRRSGSTGGLHSDGKYDEDLWYSERSNEGTWSAPKNMGKPVNTEHNNGIASITGDGQYVITAKCNESDGYGSCDIYGAQLKGNNWSTPENLGSVINSSGWDAQGSISADGKILVFSSNRDGGFGNEDIWIARKDTNGKWQKPTNLGSRINTEGSEYTPYLHPDGKTLYFSSNFRSPSLGKQDTYKTVLQDDGTWSEPENLGYPINTASDDHHFVLSPSGLYGLFASNRPGSKGDMDIYSIEFPETNRTALITFVGYVFDEETKNPIQSSVSIIDLATNKEVGTYLSNEATGKFVVVLTPGKNYALSVDKKEYLFYSENFNISSENKFQEIEKKIYLSKIKAGKKIVLNNIFFDTGLSDLRAESDYEIEKLFKIMNENPNIKVEISGHTDNVGNDASNIKLSKDRATVVTNALIKKGIDAKRLKSVGYGKSKPVADNNTSEGRQMNRRTEFQIIE